MGLRSWFSDTKDEINLAINARRAAKAIRKEIAMNHSWGKTLAAMAKDFLITAGSVFVGYVLAPENLVAFLNAALGSLSTETRADLIPFLSSLAVMVRKYWKHAIVPNISKSGAIGAVLLIAMASPAAAQEKKEFNLFEYLRTHAYVSGGPLVLDGENHTVYEVRLVDDFKISDQFRGAARVSLFSLTRAGEQAPPPKIPTTIREATEAYSDGEVWLSVYRVIKPWLALECLGGLTFKMASLSGSKGDPLDGTKSAFGCGPRFSYERNHISVIPSHYGPVADKGKLLGPAPSLLIHAHIPLTFLGKNTAFTPDVAFGADKPDPADPDQRRNITKALRLLVSARF